MYEKFAQVYDDLMREIDYKQWGDYVFRLLLNAKNEVKNVLEFGCGTGNITSELAQKGYAVTAVDLSEEMLTVADEKIAEQNLADVRFFMGDMSNFQIGEEFDAVVSCCDSVNYLPDKEAVQNFIYCSQDALKSGGLLLFDINTPVKFKEVIKDNTYVYDLDNVYCVWENSPDFEAGRMDYDLSFFIKEEDGRYSRYDESQSQYIYTVEEIYHMLKNAGFINIKIYAFGTFLQGSNECDRVQFVAEKK